MRPRLLSLVLDDGLAAQARSFTELLGAQRATLVADVLTLEREPQAWRPFVEAGHDLAVRLPLRLSSAQTADPAALQAFSTHARRLVTDLGSPRLLVRVGEPLEAAVPAEAVLQGGGAPFALEPTPGHLARLRPWLVELETAADLERARQVLTGAAAGSWVVVAVEGLGASRLPPAHLASLLAHALKNGWTVRPVGEVLARFGPPSAFEELVDLCGQLDRPGVALDAAHLVDYVERRTTPDQRRIEEVLEIEGVDGREILHVGVGNSSLARRFWARARRIVGLTVAPNERLAAEALGLANYTVHLESKYSPRIRALGGRFDLVVDNNLASFACCRYHFYAMFDAYLALLKPGGRILTDRAGMQWSAGDARFRLSFEDLLKLERKLPVAVSRVTDLVFALTSTRDD